MMENRWLEIDNNNPFTLLEIEELVTEETKHNQQQPNHLVWDWGAGGRGNKTQPTIGDWGAGDRGNKQPTTTNSIGGGWGAGDRENKTQPTSTKSQWRLRSWWQRKQNTTIINQITMEVEELVTEETKHNHHQPNHNGGWGAGDRGNKQPTTPNSHSWTVRSWWQSKNTTNNNQITNIWKTTTTNNHHCTKFCSSYGTRLLWLKTGKVITQFPEKTWGRSSTALSRA